MPMNCPRALPAAALAALVLLAFLPGSSIAGTTDVSISNTAPVVLSVSLPSSVSPTAGSTTSVSTSIVIEDLNGCSDVQYVNLTVLKPDGTTHISSSEATYSSCSDGTNATYTKTFSMNYHDAAALLTNYYKVKILATDAAGATGDNTLDLALFNYAELVALNLNLSTVSLGTSIVPNTTTTTKELGVSNYGNVQIDVQLSGTDLAHATESASIAVGNLKYSTASDMSGSAALSGSATTLSAFDLAKGSGSSKTLYWQLSVPSGDNQWIPSGSYSGTLTVGAVAG